MKTKLLKGLDEQQTSDIKQNFVHSAPMRAQIQKVLREDISVLLDSMVNEDLYENPNWELVQADKIAQIKMLRKLISYLD